MIDLHTHTTASDGRSTPEELVSRAAAAGVTVLSVTDHDTTAAAAPASTACAAAGIEFVPGIEVTALWQETDVHILGYFIDVHAAGLLSFLSEQRLRRIERVRRIVARLGELGMHLDADALVRPALEDAAKSAGRPWVARAMTAAGFVQTPDMAFQKWLARGKPAFVPRLAAEPREVVRRIHEAGGIASLAHPALIRHDEWIPEFISAGIDALEVYHTEHDDEARRKYLAIAKREHLLISGGSDYHGDNAHGAGAPGATTLPRDAYDALRNRMRHN